MPTSSKSRYGNWKWSCWAGPDISPKKWRRQHGRSKELPLWHKYQQPAYWSMVVFAAQAMCPVLAWRVPHPEGRWTVLRGHPRQKSCAILLRETGPGVRKSLDVNMHTQSCSECCIYLVIKDISSRMTKFEIYEELRLGGADTGKIRMVLQTFTAHSMSTRFISHWTICCSPELLPAASQKQFFLTIFSSLTWCQRHTESLPSLPQTAADLTLVALLHGILAIYSVALSMDVFKIIDRPTLEDGNEWGFRSHFNCKIVFSCNPWEWSQLLEGNCALILWRYWNNLIFWPPYI